MNPISLFFEQVKAYISIIIVVAIFASIVASFFYGKHVQSMENEIHRAEEIAQLNEQIKEKQAVVDKISTDFENKLANLKVVNTTINRNYTKELTNTVYTDCKIPTTGVALVNDTVVKLNLSRTLKGIKE